MKKTILSLLLMTALFACKKEDKNNNEQIFSGPKQQFHDGKAWSWIRMTKAGVPLQLAISVDDAAMNSLPTAVKEGEGGHHAHANSIVLPLHQKAMDATLFKTIGIDWNPAGHEPAGIYTTPHFDFHFYLITETERLAATDMGRLTALPNAAYLPPTYFSTGPVPQMGTHWLDATSPELAPVNPAPFTQTFVYGSYDGKVNFYEPMITLDYLKKTPLLERAIPQPTKFAVAGYYPTKMIVVKQNGVTQIILDGFIKQQAS